ncbi:MAG: lysylphosphatidylglycerol synthase domain-containing protein [Burkholderiaceae bacterium]|nr:lysylphosphatidylglycerol synthase domain-containing protein [Burkholderiaceae bacterium]
MSRAERSPLHRWGARALLLGFFCLAGWLAWRQARTVDWSEVLATLRDYRATTLTLAFGLAAASYVLYGCFDILSRRYVGARVSNGRAVLIGAVSYAFNLNIGSIVGGAGFRLRLYSRLGVEQRRIAAMIAFSIATNWIGYLLVAGTVFAIGGVEFPEGWKAGDGAMRIVGAIMVAASLGYAMLCRFSPRREISFRGRTFRLPSCGMALQQLLLGASNWLVIAAVVFVLLGHQVSYATAVAVICVASIAGAVAHIPGGLGVIEGVFVAMLGWSIGTGTILAAVLAYRAVYYLVPLMAAGVLFLALELLARRSAAAPPPTAARPSPDAGR